MKKNIGALLEDERNFLGKWLWFMFLLFIPEVISAIMTTEGLSFPAWVMIAGTILALVSSAAYAFCLFKMSKMENVYRSAALAQFIAIAAQLSIGITSTQADPAVMGLMSLCVMVVALYGQIQEFQGHVSVFKRAEGSVAMEWNSVLKWYIASFFLGIVASILTLSAPGNIAFIFTFVYICLEFVVQVRKIMLLYKSAKVFRN